MKLLFHWILKIIKTIFIIAVSVVLLMIIAWQVDTRFLHIVGNENNNTRKPQIEIPKDQITCEERGGVWKKAGLFPNPVCNIKTSDFGKECWNQHQCEGACIKNVPQKDLSDGMRGKKIYFTKGTCSEWVQNFGCQWFVNNRIARVICYD